MDRWPEGAKSAHHTTCIIYSSCLSLVPKDLKLIVNPQNFRVHEFWDLSLHGTLSLFSFLPLCTQVLKKIIVDLFKFINLIELIKINVNINNLDCE